MSAFQKYVVPTIGVAAFVVGGLLAKMKAEEMVGDLREALSNNPSEDS